VEGERENMLTLIKRRESKIIYINFRQSRLPSKESYQNERGHFIMAKQLILQEDITILMCVHLTKEPHQNM
jgi:hypothetical protein